MFLHSFRIFQVEDFLSIFYSKKEDEDKKRQDREMYWGSKKILHKRIFINIM